MKRSILSRGQSVVSFLTVVVFILLLIGMAEATEFCVSTAGELQSALTEAQGNGQDDVIRIVQGTYYGNFIYASTETHDLIIEGGYEDECTSRVVYPANTVLDAGGSGVVLALSAPSVAIDLVVDGLALQNGKAIAGNKGGGLYVNTIGNITVRSSALVNNSTDYDDGGGAYIYGPVSVHLEGNVISDNIANLITGNSNGGGVLVESSRVLIIDNEIRNNSSEYGGGAMITADEVSMVGNTISNNFGGGFSLITPTATISNNIISDNTNAKDGGGGFISGPVTAVVDSNIFSNNSCDIEPCYGGGLGFLYSYTVELTRNIFKYNASKALGGGVGFAQARIIILNNNIISYNNAKNGGGVGLFQPLVKNTMTNNTIVNNSAQEGGGGIYVYSDKDTQITDIFNNIIYKNNSPQGGDLHLNNDADNNYLPSPVNLFNNDFDHRKPEGIYMQVDFPIHSSNLDNLAPEFVDPDPPNEDYHLKEGSPCINTGDSGAPGLPTTDKDGLARIAGSSVDIGAYEYQAFIEPEATFSAFPLSGVSPLSVNFTDGSTGTIDKWYWDFGDGDISNERNPTHVYEAQGTYSVSLIVTGDSVSDTETMIDYVTVISPDAPDLSGGCKEFHSYEFGQRIVMKVQIKNNGIEKANSFEVAFYLSDSVATLGDLVGQKSIHGHLNSGHEKNASFRYESPTPLSGKYIRAVIDSNQEVPELDETNNEVSIRIP
jgi:PKD repeat protein